MKVLDVNVLVAANRSDHPHHQVAREWLEGATRTGERFSAVDLVAGSFLRLITSHRVVNEPETIPDALAFVRALRAQPNHVDAAPGPRHLDLLERLCVAADATGDLVPDAQLAAIAVEHGGTVVSFDRDFARFGGAVRWERPE